MSDLIPSDLVDEILSRVPAASLTRLRSTCKRWNTLFKDRRFTEKHSRKAAKQSLVLMLKEFRIFLVSVRLNVANPSEFKVPPSPKNSHSNLEKVYIFELFHCGGLLLCNTFHDRLLVWNPCLGETRWIQPKTDYDHRFSTFYLGYENNKSCHSYKILRCYQYKLFGSEIYEFSSDSWRVLDVVDPDCHIESLNGVSLNGNTYWLAFDRTDKFVLSFDFTRERFGRFCLPAFQNFGWVALSVVREEKLSVLHRSFDISSKMDIWVTSNIDTEAVLWSKSFTVDIPTTDGHFHHILTSFLIEETKVAVCCNSSFEPNSPKMEYVIHKYHTESTSAETTHVSELPFIFSYVPSLVQIQQFEGKKKETNQSIK